MEINLEDQWIADQLAAIEPTWQPDRVHAREMLDARLRTRPGVSPWAVAASAAAVVCIAVLALPQTRAMAQGLWDHYVLNRIDVVRLDLSRSPLVAHVTSNGLEQSARDAAEAGQLAGFTPYLPAGILPGNPGITVTGPMVADQTIHVNDLKSALAKLGAGDEPVPAEWEGVDLRAAIGPIVTADYPNQVQIVQTRPFSLTVPTGFPLQRFAEVAFRSMGVSSRDAADMARKFAANPAWFVDISPETVVNIQELSLVNGPAMLMENFNGSGAVGSATVIRSTSDRIYSVTSPTRDLSVKIAAALP